MKKHLKLLSVVFVIASIVIALSLSVSAANPRLVDDADLLTDSEKSVLLERLDSLSSQNDFDIVIVTADNLSGYSFYGAFYSDEDIEEFADDYFDANGYGFGENHDGVLLAVNMNDRAYHISTSGSGIDAISDYDIEQLGGMIVSYLADADYYNAFSAFADEAAQCVIDYRNGVTDEYTYGDENYGEYNYGNYGEYNYRNTLTKAEKFKEDAPKNAIVSIIIGLVVGFISVTSMKNKLTSVSHKSGAADYAVTDSISFSNNAEVFLYNNITAVPKPKDPPQNKTGGGGGFSGSTVHTSHSGSSHGGGGGHF
jgi:uncharacterized protein